MASRPYFSGPSALPPDRRTGRGSFSRAVGSFVPKLTAKAFERYGFHSAEIMTAWPRVAGENIARICQPERIKWPRGGAASETGETGGEAATLVLRTEPAFALDVQYRAAQITDRINRYFGYRAIAAVRVIQAPLTRPPAPTVAGVRPAQSAAAAPAPGTDPLTAALGALAASVATEDSQRRPRS